MKVKYNVKGVDPGGDRTLPKAAVHRCKVIACVVGEPSGKDKRLEVQYQIMDDEPKGSKGYILYDYINLVREDLNWKLAQFIKAMGLPESGAFDAEDVVGTGLNIRVKIRPETEEFAAKAVPGLLLPLDGEDEDDEDLSEDEDADDDAEEVDGEAEEEEEPYTQEELEELSSADLKAVAEELEVEVPARLTSKSKPKLIEEILEAQGGSEEEDEDESDEDMYEEDDLNEMDEDGLKEVLEEFELDADEYTTKKKVGKRTKTVFDTEAAVAAILEAQGEDEDGDEEPPDYDAMSLQDLKDMAKERKLDVKGSKKVLITRLKKDDEPF